MNRQTLRTSALLASALLALSLSSPAQSADRTGREVVEKTCATCHAAGKDGAPAIGDFAAWAKRAQGGFGKLAEHAIAGTGKMPAHGGQLDPDGSGNQPRHCLHGHGRTGCRPQQTLCLTRKGTGEQLVNSHCVNCHGNGTDGAPRVGNFAEWKPRLQKGIDGLVQSAISGHKGMPSRAGLTQLSDSDLRNAATYMVVQSATLSRK